MTVEALAPAKVNLALHITGQRDDGYHLLDTLVAFGPVADRLTLEPAERLDLAITGPEAAGLPAGEDNLVLRAARLVANGTGASITLDKHLPVASGIGGGSSDAAAAVRGLLALSGRDADLAALRLPDGRTDDLVRGLLTLGADVPMCLSPRGLRAGGIGERIVPVNLPPLPCVLVNPRVPVATGAVFRELAGRTGAALPRKIPEFGAAGEVIRWLRTMRNDLESPAIELVPEIAELLEVLRALPGSGLARMSGSGATCFALFEDAAHARSAAEKLRRTHGRWWIAEGMLEERAEWVEPQMR